MMSPWEGSWAWSVPIVMLTVVVHVFGLGILNDHMVGLLNRAREHRYFLATFGAAMSASVLVATILHALEAAIWACAYWFLGALPDPRQAMLYSVEAMTSYGHSRLELAEHWRMMGAIESINGWLLFGLTAAFLFSMIQRAWPPGSRIRHRPPELPATPPD